MMELTYIYGDDCAKCHQLKPRVEKWCKDKGYNFVAMKYADSGMEITSIPTAIVNEGGEDEILDFDGIVALVSKG